jgi:S-(hydroxymethyl)glutathione dehydrogenase/alcohol dehydrogenase
VPRLGTEASFIVASIYNDKSILGCRYGSTRPHHDIPLIVRLYLDGRFKLDEMVSRTYPLAAIADAIGDLEGGRLNRGVLELA